jgi:hypothetical protein
MGSGRLYQATIALLLVLSVSVVGAAVTYSRGHGATRVQQAVLQEDNALPAPNSAPAEENRAVPNDPPAGSLPSDSVTPEESGALEKQLRSYRVRLAADRTLSGQVNVFDPATGAVMAMSDIRVMFLQNGIIKARTTPGPDGVFKLPLEPGVYAIVASGPRGYAAYGLQALAPDTSVVHTAAFQEITDTLQISTLAIPSRDFQTAKRLARTYIPRELLEKSNDAGGNGNGLADETEAPPLDAAPETSLDGHSVSVRDGVLLGRMRRLHPQTGKPLKIRRLNAFLVQNNSVLAQASVNESGSFKFKNVDPGVYSFVAAGSDGLAAFSFQAINSTVASKDTPTELTLVSFQGSDGGASGSTTGSENAGAATDAIGDGDGDDDGTGGAGEGAGEGGAGGGGTGGGTGGGGGVGGGGDGLLGALIGAGVGAAIGAALADDDNDNKSPSTPDM